MSKLLQSLVAALLVGLVASVASAQSHAPRLTATRVLTEVVLAQGKGKDGRTFRLFSRPGSPRWKGERPAPNQKPILQWLIVCIVLGLVLFVVCLPSRRPYGD